MTCITGASSTDCTVPFSDFYNGSVATFNTPFFSAGDMFISLLLVIGIVLAIIAMIQRAIFANKIKRKFLGVNTIDGKEIFDI